MRMKRDEAAERLAEELDDIKEKLKQRSPELTSQGGLASMADEDQKVMMEYAELHVKVCKDFATARQLFGEQAALACLCLSALTGLTTVGATEETILNARKIMLKHLRKMEGNDGT